MKKLNKKKTVRSQGISVFMLAASIAALMTVGALPMENVKALKENAATEQETITENEEFQDTVKTSESEETETALEISQTEKISKTSENPEASQIFQTSENPETSLAEETSQISQTEEAPENPDTPATPDISETSEISETLQTSQISELSETLETGSNISTLASEAIRTDLSDEDFEIYLGGEKGSEKEKFSNFQAWKDYLAAHDNWINDDVYICLTETGLKYYDSLSINGTADSSANTSVCLINADMPEKEISIVAKKYKDGTTISSDAKTFKIGIDKKLPVIKNFTASNDCYAPTSTENVKYFPKKLVITVEAFDAGSGITSIEYAANVENAAKWIKIEKSDKTSGETQFTLELKNGIYDAIALRAIDKAGNISDPVYFKNKNDEFIKAVIDDRPPDIEIFMTADNIPYSADGENWTNKEINFTICEKDSENAAGIYLVQYAYQSIVPALLGEEPKDDDWHTLEPDEEGKAHFSVGGDSENPAHQNGYYYFKATSKCGIQNSQYVEKRILLWQQTVSKMPLIQSNADTAKCHNEWYNKESGLPIINFEYPTYNTAILSDEYAPPMTIYYNLSVEDENEAVSSLAANKSASIQTKIPIALSEDKKFEGFEIIQDDLSEMQITFPEDGIYTLEYWISDAAGNESEMDVFTYKIDCTPPTDLKLFLADEEYPLVNENAHLYEKFYNASVTCHASAQYGVSGKESITVLKAKHTGGWNNSESGEDAEQFSIAPNMRGVLCIRAVDGAGNTTEGWSRGIVVDNEAPRGDGAAEMIIEPKGANIHGFFNADVKLEIRIKDFPDDQNSAALRLVTEDISVDEKKFVSGKELFLGASENISEDTLTQSEKFNFTETINAQTCEGNSVQISVRAVDRSGNESTYSRELKIDVTKPEIEILFDSENALNGSYYSSARRAEIKIKELNFDASLVEINVTKDGEPFYPAVSQWQSENNNHTAYVDFSEDGDYTISVKCRDLADNESDETAAEPFTIDMTQPRASIILENGGQKEYFNRSLTAVITVTEHNFDAEAFRINMQPAGTTGSWEHKGDTHVIKVNFLDEGECSLSCEYMDLAGNDIADEDKAAMPIEFIIDTTLPVITISGVENNSANSGKVVPVITVLDKNLELFGTQITLTTGRGKNVNISADIASSLTEGGFAYTLKGLDDKADDIYYLEINASDKAQNISKALCRFSLNRRGSAYDVTGFEKVTKKYYNNYNTLEDIKIIEMNVDKVEIFELYLSHNTDIIYGANGTRPQKADQSTLSAAALYDVNISGDEDTGYVYTYTLYRENFALEGTYRLGIYSKDRAGNEVNNMLELNGEEVQFIIDNTAPSVVIEGVEDNEIYDVEAQDVHVSAQDNFKLASAEIILVNRDGKVLESWDYLDLAQKEGDIVTITISGRNEELSLLYRAADEAGNEIYTPQEEKAAKTDFLVTANKFVQLINKPEKTPIGRFMIFSLSGISGVGLMAVYAAFMKKCR